MALIGIISNKKCFENVKNEILKKEMNANVIHINEKSMENMKNIKFELIVIENDLEKSNIRNEQFEKICKEATYVIINTDLNLQLKDCKDTNIITYGINQKANITISSNTEDYVLIYWQKVIKDMNGKNIEIEEKKVEKKMEDKLKIDEIIILYIIFKLYNNA